MGKVGDGGGGERVTTGRGEMGKGVVGWGGGGLDGWSEREVVGGGGR